MKFLNLWESDFINNITYVNDIEKVIKLIKNGDITGNFIVMNEYDYTFHSPRSELENLIVKNNLHVNYTDNNHQVLYDNSGLDFTNPIFSIDFFNKYKDIIINTFKEYILSNDYFIYINNYTFSIELFNKLLEQEKSPLYFFNVNLSNEQILKLQEKHIEAYIDNKQISNNFLFLDYTKEDLREEYDLILDYSDIDEINPIYFKYLPDKAKITFELNENIYELEQYIKLKAFLLQIDKLSKPFQINIYFNKMILLDKSELLSDNYKNLNLILNETYGSYTIEEYHEINRQLDKLIKDIKNSNLSNFEKYIAIYNIVKNFKPYKQSDNGDDKDRFLKDILNNEFIVCAGFTKLLECLLDKVNINSQELILDIDGSYDDGFTNEEIPVNKICHARLLVNIDDDKYNIHGIYVTDPTWDNDLENDYLNHSLMTLDKMQCSDSLFWNEDLILLLDVHSFQEFNSHVNFIFKKYLNELLKENRTYKLNYSNNQIILNSYKNIINLLKQTFEIVDLNNWERMYSKYKFENENDYLNFLTEIGNYIVSRVNKSFNSQKIVKAHLTGKKELLNLKRKQLNEKRIKLSKVFFERQKELFPYYLKNKTYLEEKDRITRK